MTVELNPEQKGRPMTLNPTDAQWTPGVTPTRVTCRHGVVIAAGTYLRGVTATGDHDACWQAYEDAGRRDAHGEYEHLGPSR